jgi:hypothetical protein
MTEGEYIEFIRQFRKPEIVAWFEPGELLVDKQTFEKNREILGHINLDDLKFDVKLDFCGFTLPSKLTLRMKEIKTSLLDEGPSSSISISKILYEIEEVLSNEIDFKRFDSKLTESLFVRKNIEPRDTISPKVKLLEGEFYNRLFLFYDILFERLKNLKESLERLDRSRNVILKESFTLIKLDRYKHNLAKSCKKLRDGRFIHDSTDKEDFKKAFRGKEIDNQIDWTGGIVALKYFINTALKEKRIESPKRNRYNTVRYCFKLDGSNIPENQNWTQSDPGPKVKKQLKSIVDMLHDE